MTMRATREALETYANGMWIRDVERVLAEVAVFERIAEAVDALRKAEDANGWRSDAYIGEYQEQLVALYVALADLDRLRGDSTVPAPDKSNRSNSGQTEPEEESAGLSGREPVTPSGAKPSQKSGGDRGGTRPSGVTPSGSACPCDGGEGCVCQQ